MKVHSKDITRFINITLTCDLGCPKKITGLIYQCVCTDTKYHSAETVIFCTFSHVTQCSLHLQKFSFFQFLILKKVQ